MRALVLLCLIPLVGCVGNDRNEGFTATSPTSFLYSARTSTMMTENDDGEAERIRQGWLVAALRAHTMCELGYVVDTRRFVPGPPTAAGPQFSNGGDILYSGRCMIPGAPPAPIAPPPAAPPVRG
ncbi:MAG TPA: hypothetical protein VM782_06085 [Stellaceae bacterium]|nr:hypothetical protein [Stellaceae bacterium]